MRLQKKLIGEEIIFIAGIPPEGGVQGVMAMRMEQIILMMMTVVSIVAVLNEDGMRVMMIMMIVTHQDVEMSKRIRHQDIISVAEETFVV